MDLIEFANACAKAVIFALLAINIALWNETSPAERHFWQLR
jgi:hypothetical protein